MTPGPMDWIDLRVEGDPHPRRFDSAASLRAYLLRVERLSAEAADELLIAGELHPPHARRSLQVRLLGPG